MYFSDGTLKFGLSQQLFARLPDVRREKRRVGVRAVCSITSKKIEYRHHRAEKELLIRARKIWNQHSAGTEWFENVPYGAAKTLLIQMSRKYRR